MGVHEEKESQPAWVRPASESAVGDPARHDAHVDAVVGLLADDSPAVRRAVRRELAGLGARARGALRRASCSPRPALRARARAVLLDQDHLRSVGRLARYAERPDLELERGLLMLGRLAHPRLDTRPYVRALDSFAALARERARTPGMDAVDALIGVLVGQLGFTGSSSDYYAQDNVFLHRTIERRRGMPLTLTAVYLSVARRLGIRAAAVPLPGHVILRLQRGDEDLLVDPFCRGELRTEEDCHLYLRDHGMAMQASWFRDADDVALFQRQVFNLKGSYLRRGMKLRARRLDVVLRVLRERQESGRREERQW